MKTVISPEWHKKAEQIRIEGVHTDYYPITLANSDGYIQGAEAYASSAKKWLKDKLTEVKKDFCIDETDKAQQFVKELMLEELLTELKTLKPL